MEPSHNRCCRRERRAYNFYRGGARTLILKRVFFIMRKRIAWVHRQFRARHQRPTLTRRGFILIFVLNCTHTSTSVIVQTLIFTLSLRENDARGTVGESFSFPDHVSTSECNIHQHNKTNYRLNFLHALNTFTRIGLP